MGFPETKTEVEVKILSDLFSEEEAETALILSPRPKTANTLAKKLGKDPDEMSALLEKMADKGQILPVGKKDNRSYLLVPYVPGFWEYQVNRLGKEAAEDYEAYYEVQAKDMFGSATPPVRVVTVEEEVPGTLKIYPFELASQIIKEADKLALADCICRKHHKMLGKGCENPHEGVCIYLSTVAEYYIERGFGREVSVDDALNVIEMGEQAGLVRTTWLNVQKKPNGLCQCCPCCCHALRAAYELEMPNAVAKSNFVPLINTDLCDGCESCVEICPMDSLSLDEDQIATRDPDRCIGCGLCASACPTNSISLERLPEDQIVIPPETYTQLMIEIAHEKGRTHFYK
jgi:NAD-dependent dihydropyrimidine dehydrogenase PreA subunit